jgi:hypothetical protein
VGLLPADASRQRAGMKPAILALDLEGTLISNAVTQFPRPGLRTFLNECRSLFPRVVAFTTVKEPRFRAIASMLVEEGTAPAWFQSIEYVQWAGPTKDLASVQGARPEQVLLLDDCADYVHLGQEPQWVPIDQFAPPYSPSDRGLAAALVAIKQRL